MPQKHNYMMDLFKGIAAIGVVLVHFQFPGMPGSILCSVGVAGVVFFFLISGYFAYSDDDEKACKNLKKRFGRNAIITLEAAAVYLIVSVIREIIMGDLDEWITKFTDPVLYFRIIIMGDFEIIHGDPLWFMPALLYSYLILYFIHRFKLTKPAYCMLPVLLLLRIGTETFTNTYGADWHLSGNFLVGALPIMLLGHFIASHKDKIAAASLSVISVCCIVSALLMFVTVNIRIGGFDVSQPFKIWCAASVFLLSLKEPDKKVCGPVISLGDRCSLNIYLWHYLIGTVIKDILIANNAPEPIIGWVLPIIVIFTSIGVSVAVYRIKNTTRSEKQI